jgi:hypothetical protein
MDQMGKIGETIRVGVREIFTLGARWARTDQQDQQPALAGQTGRNGDEWSMEDAATGSKGEREYIAFVLRGRESPTSHNRDHIMDTEWTPPHHMPPGTLQEETPEDTQITTTNVKPYSGFDEAIKKWGLGNISQDLAWQKNVQGDKAKIAQFRDLVGGLQDFCSYAIIKPGCGFVTVVHSVMKYVALGDATQHLQGRFIGFMGDCTSTKELTAIVLPSMKTWTWETKRVRDNALHMAECYKQDTTRRGKQWQPLPVESEDEGSDITAPLLLALPNILFQAIKK